MGKLLYKRNSAIESTIKNNVSAVKSWFLDVGYDLIESRKFTIIEETLIEEVTDYYLERLKEFEN